MAHGKGWDDFLPRVFWNQAQRGAIADGVGLVTAFAHTETPGAEVIVYEFEGTWRPGGEPEQLVTYHGTACHMDTFHDCGHVHENTGPESRRWAARQARQHIINAARHGVGDKHSACRPNNGEMLRAVNTGARDMWGTMGDPLTPTTRTAPPRAPARSSANSVPEFAARLPRLTADSQPSFRLLPDGRSVPPRASPIDGRPGRSRWSLNTEHEGEWTS